MASFPPGESDDNKSRQGRSLHWHILGGNNKHRIGANCGLCVYEETNPMGEKETRRILFDIGLLSGDPRKPEDPSLVECDTVIPDLARFLKKKDNPLHKPEEPLDAIFLTHGHADHLGAIPYLILMGYELPPIYATPYTVKRLEQELANANLDPSEWPQISAIAPGKTIQEGPVKVTAFWVSHSTPQSVGFFIETPEGNILNPGDFKLDQTLVWGPSFSEDQFRRVVNKPVDLLLLDSTGADRDMAPTTEEDMRETLRELMEKYPNKRFVIAVMSGFEENLASVAKVTAEYGRDLWVAGYSHEQALSALKETGMPLRDGIGEDIQVRVLDKGKSARDLAESKPGKSVVVVTGAQGKPSAAMTRATYGQHPSLQLDPKKDVILFCAPSIPGQEAGREKMLGTLRKNGFTVITRKEANLYPHAHARLPEIIEMAKMAGAKTILPIHGDEDLRRACAEAMGKMGQRVLPAENGDVIRVTKGESFSIQPSTKENPHFVGFKTLQGSHWTDRHYIVFETKNKKDAPPPANQNGKKPRPKMFYN